MSQATIQRPWKVPVHANYHKIKWVRSVKSNQTVRWAHTIGFMWRFSIYLIFSSEMQPLKVSINKIEYEFIDLGINLHIFIFLSIAKWNKFFNWMNRCVIDSDQQRSAQTNCCCEHVLTNSFSCSIVDTESLIDFISAYDFVFGMR